MKRKGKKQSGIKEDRRRKAFAWKGRCSWRRIQIIKRGKKESIRLKYALLAITATELAVIGGQTGAGEISLARQQEVYEVEWIVQPEKSIGRPEDLYGIRIHPGTWEMEFYHRREYFHE